MDRPPQAVADPRARRRAGPPVVRARRRQRARLVPRRRPPDRAIDDLRHVVELLDGDRDLIAALAHDVDAGPGEWRMRVYRRGAPATLAELMPLLDHLGLQALDERPATFRAGGERVHLYDIGVRVPAGVEIDARRRVELQRAFGLLVAGEVESDGFNRLVLLAGLTARDVDRAAGLRQVPPPDRLRVQPVLRRVDARRPPGARRRSRGPVPRPLRPRRRRRAARYGRRRPGSGSSRPSTPSPASTRTASAGPS